MPRASLSAPASGGGRVGRGRLELKEHRWIWKGCVARQGTGKLAASCPFLWEWSHPTQHMCRAQAGMGWRCCVGVFFWSFQFVPRSCSDSTLGLILLPGSAQGAGRFKCSELAGPWPRSHPSPFKVTTSLKAFRELGDSTFCFCLSPFL